MVKSAGRLQDKAAAEKLLLVVGCGEKSIRFRPHLIITREEIQLILQIIRKVLQRRTINRLSDIQP